MLSKNDVEKLKKIRSSIAKLIDYSIDKDLYIFDELVDIHERLTAIIKRNEGNN
jgi:hypothetical protein